jgi:hypothetical protein
MTTAPDTTGNDVLLWRARRIVARAQYTVAAGEMKTMRLVAADLRVLICQLKARVAKLSADHETVLGRRHAMMAYRRCINLKRH